MPEWLPLWYSEKMMIEKEKNVENIKSFSNNSYQPTSFSYNITLTGFSSKLIKTLSNKIVFHSKRLARDGEDTGSFKIKEMENFLSHHKELVNSNLLSISLEYFLSKKEVHTFTAWLIVCDQRVV